MDVEEILRVVPGGTYAVLVAFVVGITGVVALFYVIGKGGSSGSSSEKKNGARKRLASEDEQSETEDTGSKNKQPRHKAKLQSSSKKVTLHSHPLLAGEFKGHTGSLLSLDFDTNGKYLASCSDDRTIRLWYMKTLLDKDHKYTRKNIELDHATHVKFSPDGTAVLATMAATNTVHVYRIAKASTKGAIASLSDSVVEFPTLSSSSIISFGIASTGKFIMTCNRDSFSVWTLKGEELATVPTIQSPNTHAAVSPCGRFVACTGFTSDVKIWEVEFTKSGDFQKMSKAMDLKGHNASVLAVSFSGDSHRMASASKDGTWKYWDINVEYRLDEDPKLLATGKISSRGETCIALAPDSRVVAVSVNMSIYIYSTASGDLLETLNEVHKGVIRDLCWDPSSLYLASAGGEDRHVRVWHNVPGMKELIMDLETRLPKASSEPIKRRMNEQIQSTRERLKSIEQ